ncbi:Flp pilus assembly protein CpaB [Litorimonas sp. WD9-15]|uniref:Flp pilus assembly protein CpaB n=1 Tax=Litorimonas sp. WD9-15 TaxID=3418716 RepID=UPI003CFEDD7B
MRTNTLVTLGASAAFGVMAIVLARGWIKGAVEDEFRQVPSARAEQTNPPQQPAIPMSSVVVANADLVFGDQITPDVLRVVEMPKGTTPVEALSDLSDIFTPDYDVLENGAMIALADIKMNEVILPHRVSGLGGRGSLSARIRPGYRAASIRVDDVTGVAGFVVPGDLVDIQYISEPNPDAKIENFRSDIILQSIRVLGVDQAQNRGQEAPNIARTVTLEVSHMDAQALAVAQSRGRLSLVLRAVGEALPSTTRSLNSRELDARANSGSAAKKPKRPVKVTPKPAPPPVANIKVIRGEETQSVSVKRENQPTVTELNLAGG